MKLSWETGPPSMIKQVVHCPKAFGRRDNQVWNSVYLLFIIPCFLVCAASTQRRRCFMSTHKIYQFTKLCIQGPVLEGCFSLICTRALSMLILTWSQNWLGWSVASDPKYWMPTDMSGPKIVPQPLNWIWSCSRLYHIKSELWMGQVSWSSFRLVPLTQSFGTGKQASGFLISQNTL